MKNAKLFFFKIYILLFCFGLNGQNLVPNPSFELLDSCPPFTSGWQGMHLLQNWTCANWPRITDNADLYHCCDFFNEYVNLCEGTVPNLLPPRTGEGYVGMFVFYPDTSIVDFSEYIQVKLKQPLAAGNLYSISLWVYLNKYSPDITYIAINSLAAFFSHTELNENKWLLSDCNPQISFGEYVWDQFSWRNLTASFVALGGEEFLIIGRFIPRDEVEYFEVPHVNHFINRNSYIMIDDLAVWPADAQVHLADAGENHYVCREGQQRDSIILGMHNYDEYIYTWFDADSNVVGNSGFLTVLPNSTTWFALEVKDFKFEISRDTVWVYVVDCENPLFIPNIFSPNGDGQNDVLYVRGQGIEQLSFVVYNRWGQKVFETKDPNHGWDGTINGKPAETGVYVYHVNAVLYDGLVVSRHGDVALVR